MINLQKTSRAESLKEKPPRALLCHCLKCDNKWTVRMQLVPDLDTSTGKSNRKRDRQKRMVWIFPLDSFDTCHGCGAQNGQDPKNSKVINSILARTDGDGRIKLTRAKPTLMLDMEDELVEEQEQIS